MHISRAAVLAAAVGLLTSVPSRADLVGTSVTGSINILNLGNYGTTQVISNAGWAEFIGTYGFDTFSADFTGTGLVLKDIVASETIGAFAWTQTFENPAFADYTVALVSDDHPGGINVTQNGDILIFAWDGTGWLGDPTFTATYAFTPTGVPEPGGFAWLIGSLGTIGAGLLRRRR